METCKKCWEELDEWFCIYYNDKNYCMVCENDELMGWNN